MHMKIFECAKNFNFMRDHKLGVCDGYKAKLFFAIFYDSLQSYAKENEGKSCCLVQSLNRIRFKYCAYNSCIIYGSRN